MRFRTARRSLGFTMIELLVTVTLFSLALSSLVAGLYTGIGSWERIRMHQRRATAHELAFRTIEEDVRHLAIPTEEMPSLSETADNENRESLNLVILVPHRFHQLGQGAVWSIVTYALEEDEASGSLQLVRTEIPHVAASPLAGIERKRTILDSVEWVHFDYLSANESVATWDDPARLPPAVDVSVKIRGARPATKSIVVPMGILNPGGGA